MVSSSAWPVRNVALAALPLVAVLLAGVVVVNENQRWEAWRERLALHQQKLAEADYRRPPLFGEAQSGNAFDDYARAFVLSESLGRKPTAELNSIWMLRGQRLLEPEAELRLAEWRAALHLVRLGARRAHAEPPAARDPNASPVSVGAFLHLLRAAVLESRRHLLVGEDHAALEVVLDATGLALDTARSPLYADSFVAAHLLPIVLCDGLSAELVAALDDSGKRKLLVALDRIDALLPLGFSLHSEHARNFECVEELASNHMGGPVYRAFLLWNARETLDPGPIDPDTPPPDPWPWTDMRNRVHTLRASVEHSLGGWRSERETRVDGGGSGRRGVHGAGQRPAGS